MVECALVAQWGEHSLSQCGGDDMSKIKIHKMIIGVWHVRTKGLLYSNIFFAD